MDFWKWIQDRLKYFNNSAEADLAFRQGVYQRQQGNYEKAIEFLTKALDLNPNHVSAYIYRGHVRRQIGDIEGAQRDYDAAFRLDPFAAAHWVNQNQHQAAARRPEPNRIREPETEPVASQETSESAPDLRASTLGGGTGSKAESDVHGDIFVRQAEDHQRRGDLKAAHQALDRALDLAPQNLDALRQRGIVAMQNSNWARARDDFNAVLEEKPGAADYVYRGLANYFLKDHDAAIADFSAAIAQDNEYAMAYNNRATIYRERGEIDKAMEDLNRALDIEPRNPATLLNRGETYVLKQEYMNAIDDYNKAIFLDRDNPDAYTRRAEARIQNHDVMGAISDLRRYLDLGGGEKNNNRREIEKRIKDLR